MTDDEAGILADPARLMSLRRARLSPEPDDAFDRFAELVKRLLHVPTALVSLVDDERQFFPGMVGLAEPWRDKRETPLTHSFCQYVVVRNRPTVFADVRTDPEVRGNLAITDLGVVAYAGVPLTDAEGRVLGSLCAIDSVPREWSDDDLAILTDLAAVCSSELRLRIARDVAEEARGHAEDARRHAETAHDQLTMLAGLTETLAGTLDIDEAMTRLGHAVTPHLADWSLVTLSDSTGAVRRVSAAHRDPGRLDEAHRFAELMVTGLSAGSMALAVQRSGRPIRRSGETPEKLLSRITDPEMVQIADRLGYASFLIAPIMAPGGQSTLGSIALINGAQRPAFTEADERTAMDIGRRAGLAIDNSRLYRQQRHVAEVLQQSLLTDLPDIPGLELHARYLPAQDGAAVGGDWYDAFAQPDGSVMLAVGDVSGHDIEAAATMGQLRNLVRGDAFARDDEPGPLLSQLDRAVRGLGVPAAATAVLARMRRAGNDVTVTFANAGHPPPILLCPNGAVHIWWETPEPLLGLLPRARRTTHTRHAPAGSTLLLYTDGLIEDPAQMIDDGIARITEVLRRHAGRPAAELAARLIDAAPRRADDIALLLVRVVAV